jgi:hypothetical protein
MLRFFPISITTKLVTQTAEVAVKRASTKVRRSLVVVKEKDRRIAPIKITAAKLSTKILAGERCLEKKFLILTGILISINTSTASLKSG